jgi:methylthioribose-1-phosphate isomerase
LPACYREQETLVNAWNPVFDVTPAGLIDAIVTEAGVVLHPSAEGMARLRMS